MKVTSHQSPVTSQIKLLLVLFIVLELCGCDAFVRKFTRKQKKEELPAEQLVLAPEEYKPTMTKEEVYKQYYVFWRSWQDELMESLLRGKNHKKQVDCAVQAAKNLEQMLIMLNEQKRKELTKFLTKMNDLKSDIEDDSYAANSNSHYLKAEHLKVSILRQFAYNNIKGSLL